MTTRHHVRLKAECVRRRDTGRLQKLGEIECGRGVRDERRRQSLASHRPNLQHYAGCGGKERGGGGGGHERETRCEFFAREEEWQWLGTVGERIHVKHTQRCGGGRSERDEAAANGTRYGSRGGGEGGGERGAVSRH